MIEIERNTCYEIPLSSIDMQTEHIIIKHLATGDVSQNWPYTKCSNCMTCFPVGSKYCPYCGARVVDE